MTEPTSGTVRYEVEDGVATITLNRPEAMNGLDVATKEALLGAVREAAADDAVRCVVLTGSGRAFCVGQDLKEHITILESSDAESLFRTVEEHYNPIVTALATMPKPVVAAVNGVAAGAGASLAFACDFRDAHRVGRLQPGLHRRRAVLRHRLLVDPAPHRRPGEGAGAALLPAHDRLGGVTRARAGDHGRRRRRVRGRGRAARAPAGGRPDGVLRRDPPVGGVLRRRTTSPSRWSSRAR